jgi:hypothetical protein
MTIETTCAPGSNVHCPAVAMPEPSFLAESAVLLVLIGLIYALSRRKMKR